MLLHVGMYIIIRPDHTLWLHHHGEHDRLVYPRHRLPVIRGWAVPMSGLAVRLAIFLLGRIAPVRCLPNMRVNIDHDVHSQALGATPTPTAVRASLAERISAPVSDPNPII